MVTTTDGSIGSSQEVSGCAHVPTAIRWAKEVNRSWLLFCHRSGLIPSNLPLYLVPILNKDQREERQRAMDGCVECRAAFFSTLDRLATEFPTCPSKRSLLSYIIEPRGEEEIGVHLKNCDFCKQEHEQLKRYYS